MISASVAGTHRFGRVKKNGYDPAEVDAIVGRLIDALEEYQDRAKHLERKLDDSHVSAAAISRTLAAVEETKAQILAEAETDADLITAHAHAEAEKVAVLAAGLGAEVSARRDAILTEAFREADAAIARSQMQIAEQQIEAATTAASIITEAVARADEAEREASDSLRTASMVAAWRSRESELAARTRILKAEAQAAAIIEQAERESDRLGDRVQELRAAVSNLQASAADLARDTIKRADVIDLEAIAARDTSAEEPAPVVPIDRTVKRYSPPPDTPTKVETDDSPETYYQRRAGGIKERIKIARLIN
ncbi:MAG: DivIVA domain-containing protein [Armatimonadetes bacterium]|nr:MAG: DivIVA domain-containing protein [Armatimonadota bacterium]